IDARPTEVESNAWVEGIAAIDRKLRALLESEGVSPIDAAPGRRFDPREHEAIANVPGTGRADGDIVEEVRRGYRLRDRVIRPALVAVAEDGPGRSGGTRPATDDAINRTTDATTDTSND
ncbi:MAG TPA: nucleotide exchange factor GrpE, partial [Candidatus Limnocylindrales bacterium]